ncbi:hypothetical protein [Brevundimonas sp.]|uniref:hypothetical protein n=1 Tax=Brevundimonas sp. TaxID=1871086 RepID=UPI00289BD793|nr:hypothetical protein [Brevundimonas sp.]
MIVRSARNAALLAGFALLGACATFPKRPPLIGYDPAPYGDAFCAAATQAVLRDSLGQGAYAAFGDEVYRMGRQGPCSAASLADFVAGRRGCAIMLPAGGPDCRETDLCLRFTMDRELARDPRVWSAVESALRQPCDTLTPPKELPYARWPSAVGNPAWASWTLLRCDRRRQVTGSAVTLSDSGDQTVVRLTFALTSPR